MVSDHSKAAILYSAVRRCTSKFKKKRNKWKTKQHHKTKTNEEKVCQNSKKTHRKRRGRRRLPSAAQPKHQGHATSLRPVHRRAVGVLPRRTSARLVAQVLPTAAAAAAPSSFRLFIFLPSLPVIDIDSGLLSKLRDVVLRPMQLTTAGAAAQAGLLDRGTVYAAEVLCARISGAAAATIQGLRRAASHVSCFQTCTTLCCSDRIWMNAVYLT